MRSLMFGSAVVLSVALMGMSQVFAQQRAGARSQNAAERQPTADAETKVDTPDDEPESEEGYLGVRVTQLAVNSRQIDLARGQGLRVVHVVEDSPAAKAGIQDRDILASYGNQRIFTPGQLTRMVRADDPGAQVKVDIIRDGEKKSIVVQLAQAVRETRRNREVGEARDSARDRGLARDREGGPVREALRDRDSRFGERLRLQFQPARIIDAIDQIAAINDESHWVDLESMTVTNLGDHRFRVEIKYRDEQGHSAQESFEGTREEIEKGVMEKEDMPASERAHVLQAIGKPLASFGANPANWLLPEELNPAEP